MWTATPQFASHYLTERNDQGLANRSINPERCCGRKTGAVEQRQRLGGLLNYYYRAVVGGKRPDHRRLRFRDNAGTMADRLRQLGLCLTAR